MDNLQQAILKEDKRNPGGGYYLKLGNVIYFVKSAEIGDELSQVKREAVYNDAMSSIWGLGRFFPFKREVRLPDNSKEFFVYEVTPTKKVELDHNHGFETAEEQELLFSANENGSLDKLALAEVIMGKDDGCLHNFELCNQSPFIQIIHSPFVFQHTVKYVPQYRHLIDWIEGAFQPIAASAFTWLAYIDPNALKEFLIKERLDEESTSGVLDRFGKVRKYLSENLGEGNWDKLMQVL